jgi:hypothetical protein
LVINELEKRSSLLPLLFANFPRKNFQHSLLPPLFLSLLSLKKFFFKLLGRWGSREEADPK